MGGAAATRERVSSRNSLPGAPNLAQILLSLGALLAFLGYVGPWVDHRVAGLAILGLDLGEYVKFLPQVRAGAPPVWREGFYLPLVAVSLTLSLCTWRADLRWPGAQRAGAKGSPTPAPSHPRTLSLAGWLLIALQVLAAIVAALNLLPPAWTPQRMLTPEFQLQAAALALCLAAVALGPFLALLPRLVTGPVVLLLSLWAAVVPVQQFLAVLPEIAELYHHPLTPGWGMYAMLAGLLLLMALGVVFIVNGLPKRGKAYETGCNEQPAPRPDEGD